MHSQRPQEAIWSPTRMYRPHFGHSLGLRGLPDEELLVLALTDRGDAGAGVSDAIRAECRRRIRSTEMFAAVVAERTP